MMLSTEQMEAAMFGIAKDVSWRNVVRPVGPQPIPEWCTTPGCNTQVWE